jgi:hypothetical protein
VVSVLATGPTDRRVRVVNTPASYSGSLGFEFRVRRPAMLIEGFVVLLSPFRRMPA